MADTLAQSKPPSPRSLIEEKLNSGMKEGKMHECLRDTGRLAGGYEAGGTLAHADIKDLGILACKLAKNRDEAEKKWDDAVEYGRLDPLTNSGTSCSRTGKSHGDKISSRLNVADCIIVDKDLVEEREIGEPSDHLWEPAQDLSVYISTLYKSVDIVGFVTKTWFDSKAKKHKPQSGIYNRTAGDLVTSINSCNGNLSKAVGNLNSEVGAWFRLNPLDGQGIKDINVTDFRYALVESDDMPIGKQLTLIEQLELPVAALVHSGNKSLHAIVRVDAKDIDEYKQRVDFLYDKCAKNGLTVDRQNRNPSRLSRMPGVMRNGRKQFLLGINIGKESWDEWKEWFEEQTDPIKIKNLGDLKAYKVGEDPNELLQYRFWCKGGGLLFVGSAGLGKSTGMLQFCLCMAAGVPFFGIMPKEGCKFSSLIIQAENDDGDLAEQRDGVLRGNGWDQKTSEAALNRVKVATVDCLSGEDLVKWLTKKLKKADKKGELPDFIVLDPALAYIGGDNSSGQDVGAFLRGHITPLIHDFNIGILIVHHTNKPTEENRKKTLPIDATYLATGSAEWANWPRAIINLTPTKYIHTCELVLAKRGGSVQWEDEDGNKIYKKTIAHSKTPGVICWEEVSEPDYISIIEAEIFEKKLKGFISIFPMEFDLNDPAGSYLWTSKINTRRKRIEDKELKFLNDDVVELKTEASKRGLVLKWKEGQKECVMLTALYEKDSVLIESITNGKVIHEAYQIANENRQKWESKKDENENPSEPFRTLLIPV